MKSFSLSVTVLFLLCSVGYASDAPAAMDPQKEKQIRTLLELTGMTRLIDSMTDQIFTSFEQSFPSVPAEAWQRLRKKMPADEMMELIIPVYDRYYTAEDLEAVIAFYRTPVGQKVIRTLPEITRESMAIGEEWGEKKAQLVIDELKAEGLLRD